MFSKPFRAYTQGAINEAFELHNNKVPCPRVLFPSLPAFPSAPGQTSLASSGETLFPTASSPVTSPNSIPPSLEETQNIIVLVVKYPPANAGDIRDAGSIPGSRRFPGGCNGNPPQYSCLKNPMDRGSWQATVHSITKSQTQPKWLSSEAKHIRGYKIIISSSFKGVVWTGQVWKGTRNKIPFLHCLCSNDLGLKFGGILFGSLDFSIHEMGEYVSCQAEDNEDCLSSILFVCSKSQYKVLFQDELRYSARYLFEVCPEY